jgi:hypothetical protein
VHAYHLVSRSDRLQYVLDGLRRKNQIAPPEDAEPKPPSAGDVGQPLRTRSTSAPSTGWRRHPITLGRIRAGLWSIARDEYISSTIDWQFHRTRVTDVVNAVITAKNRRPPEISFVLDTLGQGFEHFKTREAPLLLNDLLLM